MTSPMDLNAGTETATPKSLKKLPFTSSERELISALVRERPIIEDKRTNARNIELKKQAWENLTVSYNAQPYVFPRNIIQLKRCWENIKTQRKKDMSQESVYMTGTGGGPSQGSSTFSSDNIVDIICPFINLKVPGVIDSNTNEIPEDLITKPSNCNKKKFTVTNIENTQEIDSRAIEFKENNKKDLDLKVPVDILNYTRNNIENIEENVAFQPKRKCFETSVGKNKLSSEVEARIKRCNLNIKQDQELHNLRIEREKVLIERERNLLKFENEMHALQKEKLLLEIKKLQ